MPNSGEKRLRTQSCRSTATVRHGRASSRLGRDRGCPAQVSTHTSSSPSNEKPLFRIPYSRARSKRTSSLFHPLSPPGEGPSPAPRLPSLCRTPLRLPQPGPSCSGQGAAENAAAHSAKETSRPRCCQHPGHTARFVGAWKACDIPDGSAQKDEFGVSLG